MIEFAGFEYVGLNNIGDNIQSLAVERLLPPIKKRFNRDTLALVKPEKKIYTVMNGWFSHTPSTCLPLNKMITPIFWGFHITNWNNSWEYFSQKKIINYLKEYEPIGCRDPYTAQRLSDLGLQTFVSHCLTMTFPKREKEPQKGKIIIVDVDPKILPKEITKKADLFTHQLPDYIINNEDEKHLLANDLLGYYNRYAKLVITCRLHCLLPCIAMNIPVIFFGNPNDYRVSWVKDIGVKINSLHKPDNIDWNGHSIEWEERKNKMIKAFKDIKSNLQY